MCSNQTNIFLKETHSGSHVHAQYGAHRVIGVIIYMQVCAVNACVLKGALMDPEVQMFL